MSYIIVCSDFKFFEVYVFTLEEAEKYALKPGDRVFEKPEGFGTLLRLARTMCCPHEGAALLMTHKQGSGDVVVSGTCGNDSVVTWTGPLGLWAVFVEVVAREP
jgi:hypothetical protein